MRDNVTADDIWPSLQGVDYLPRIPFLQRSQDATGYTALNASLFKSSDVII